MLLFLFLVGFGNAEKSVLIIGGDPNGRDTAITVEQFFPSNMSSKLIAENTGPLVYYPGVRVTPVNATHALVLQTFSPKSYFIDRQGHLILGPNVTESIGPGLASIPGENGQRLPIYCGGSQLSQGNGYVLSNTCHVLSADGLQWLPHSSMHERPQWFSLTSFGDQLVAIGERSTVERYNGTEWKRGSSAPYRHGSGGNVKLNETALLTCGSLGGGCLPYKCSVYHVDKDQWTAAPETKHPMYSSRMVLIGHTVYAFGGSGMGIASQTIQTLDISRGIGSAVWKLEDVQLGHARLSFDVWVIDSDTDGEVPI